MTKTAKQAVRDEYKAVFGGKCVELALRLKMTAREMRAELDRWKNEKAVCDQIKAS